MMNLNSTLFRLSFGGIISLAFLPLAAADTEAALPGDGFPASRYETLWSKSPFSVASADSSAPESPDYSLVGIAKFEGISYASIIDKKNNQEHFLLSSDQDSHGLRLVSVTRGQDADSTLAVLQKNGQLLTLKLDTSTSAPVAGGAGTSPAPVPVLQMPGSMPTPASFRPTYPMAGQPPPVTYRPHMINLPPQRNDLRNFQINTPPASR